MTRAWWYVLPRGKMHITECELRFHHGRHRARSSQDVRRVNGTWCRPGKILTWEPI